MEKLGDALKRLKIGAALAKIAPGGAEALAVMDDEPETACERCRGTGYYRRDVQPGHPSFGLALFCVCETGQEFVRRRQERIWSASLVPASMRAFSLVTLAEVDQKRRRLADRLRAWQQTDRWLVLHGPKGTCKTGAAVALLVEHIQDGGSGLFIKPARFLERIRETYAPDAEAGFNERAVLQTLIDAPLLVLDDIGTENLTRWGQEKLFTVIDERHDTHSPAEPRRTIVTTNLSLPKMAMHLDPEGRSWDRIRAWADTVELEGESVRGRPA